MPKNCLSSIDIERISNFDRKYIEKRLGIKKIYRSDESTSACDMAISAGMLCLNDTDKKNIDALIWTGSENKDYYVWMASAYIQNSLSIRNNIPTFDIFSQSCTDLTAIRVAKAFLYSEHNMNSILLIGGHKINDLVNYSDQDTSFLFSFSDGASCILLSKGDSNPVLSAYSICDGSFSIDVKISPIFNGLISKNVFKVNDYNSLRKRLTHRTIVNYCEVINKNLNSLNLKTGDQFFLAINHLSESILNRIIKSLNYEVKLCSSLDQFGHIGSIDPWIAVREAENREVLNSGDIVCMVSAGLGYTWSAVTFRWDKPIFKSQ
ncbi:MAG: hypothetical protein A2464_07460 [Deltaproteobacteria bacterium RIFOXYC2_FULL_48_10]|nr:MAG: hypothetical protein A2464_07460 [Deltaproteobacteria bacterium RIFOXYC2_FULL_48_10]